MRSILAVAEQVADSPATLLVSGESGTGKKLVARYVHAKSARADRPFLRLDCASAPVLTGPLLGPGSLRAGYPGHDWIGAFERAGEGTVLLDRLDALGADGQETLLALLQECQTGQYGGCAPRLIASCESDLTSEVRLGRFRPDLFARLQAICILLPPLRERRADVPILVEHFVDMYASRHDTGPCRVNADTMVHLWQYDWPGNVRELESLIERLVVLCRGGVIRTGDLPPHVRAESGLRSNGGNGRSAAQIAPGGATPGLRFG